MLMPHGFAQDVITRKDGSEDRGEIVSETESQVVMKVTSGSMTSTRNIPKSDIKDILRETPEQREARHAYEALGKLQLDPNREYAKSDYQRGIEAFNKYITTHPESKFIEEARQRMGMWKDDLSHVELGQVKFANRWMTPEEKQPLWDRSINEQRAKELLVYLQQVRQTQSQLEAQKSKTAAEIASLQAPASRSPQELANVQVRLNQLLQQLATLDTRLRETGGRVPQAAADYEAARAKLLEQPAPVMPAQAPPSPAPAVATQAVPVAATSPPATPASSAGFGSMPVWAWLLVGAAVITMVGVYAISRAAR